MGKYCKPVIMGLSLFYPRDPDLIDITHFFQNGDDSIYSYTNPDWGTSPGSRNDTRAMYFLFADEVNSKSLQTHHLGNQPVTGEYVSVFF
mmetsp:Transcript_32252/g.63872  ORF Transcript_32252/g.63872 Transcript_32252/m.63872 type:complete len:90 (+) Transcript_32252:102-371(+)